MKKRTVVVSAVAGALLVVSAPPLLPPLLKGKPAIEERTQATMAEKRANKALAKRYAWVGYGWKDMEWRCLEETSKDPAIQILHTYKYITKRYKTPCRAMKYHLRHNHY